MVVAGRNPAGVLSGQRLPCHSVFSHPAFHPLTTRLFVPNPISASISAQHKYTIERLYLTPTECIIYCIFDIVRS